MFTEFKIQKKWFCKSLGIDQHFPRVFVICNLLVFPQDPSLFDEKRKWLNERLTYKRPNWNEQLDKIDSLYQRCVEVVYNLLSLVL